MRILHTGDWHLGKNLEGVSRMDEQELFLNDFINIVEENDKEVIEEKDEDTGEIKKIKGVTYQKYKLSWEEELSLKNIDIAKEESDGFK